MAYGQDITPDKDTGIGDWTDDQLEAAMRKGVDDEGMMLCSIMPRFTDMTDTEAANIIAYLRSLPAVKRTVPDSSCD
jgi:hypothetical protein